MKKLLVLTLVLLLVAGTALPALAEDYEADGCQDDVSLSGTLRVALAGYIRAIDTTNKSVIVEVKVGNRLGELCLDKEVLIETEESTRFLLSGGTVIKFSDLKINDPVSVNATIRADDNDADTIDEWVAGRITKGALLLSK